MKTVAAYLLFLPLAWSFVAPFRSTTICTTTTRHILLPSRPQQTALADRRYAERTYGSTPEVISDLAALEARMSDFFLTHQDWQPLFRSLCADSSVPAMSFLESQEEELLKLTDAGPWDQLEAIPSAKQDKKVVADFLDGMQTAWLEQMDSDDDMPFILEGRRLLAVSRFQVVASQAADNQSSSTSTTQEDLLFATCWNELAELSRNDQVDTGSLIVLPTDFHKDDLQEFLATRIQQPLEWLGLDPYFEIGAIQRSSALRLLHKLSDPPTGDVGGEIIRM